MPKVSVIVPVYGAEKYVERCIDSILAQSFTDFETILVDDGSPDRSGEICDAYAIKDSRVRVFHKENGGVSSARNLGIEEAQGEWVCFVDSDDYVTPSYVYNLLKGIPDDYNRSIMVWGSYIIDEKKRKEFPDIVFKEEEAVKYILENNVLALSGPVAKLFSRDLLAKEAIFFPTGIQMGEDGIFVQRYLNSVKAVSFVSASDYYVRRTDGSLSKRYYSFETEWKCFEIWKKLITDYAYKYEGLFANPHAIVWNNRIGQTFFRSLVSVAHQSPKWPLTKQYKVIKNYSLPEVNNFQYYISNNRNTTFLKCLICNRFFILFVILLNFSIIIKRLLKKENS